jgi:hypothetical protein
MREKYILERDGADILHDVEEAVSLPTDIEQRHHRGVGDLLQHPHLAFEATPIDLVEPLRHQLDRHESTVSRLIVATPDISHAATTDADIEAVSVIEQLLGCGSRHRSSFRETKWPGSIHIVSFAG